MKILFTSLLFVLSIFSVNALHLEQAISEKKVTVKTNFNFLGKQGITLTILNNTTSPLKIEIPAGTIFEPENEDEQTLMNVEEKILAMKPKETTVVEVDGYCIMADKRCPKTANNFTISHVNHQNLNSFLGFIQKEKVSEMNLQAAIWAITDNEDIGAIEPTLDGDVKLREHISKMTGRENPWYTRKQEIIATPGEVIQRRSADVRGELEIFAQNNMKVIMTVENDQNEVKVKFKNVMKLVKNSENSFNFRIRVNTWEVGNYRVVIRKADTNEEVKRFDFEI